MAELPKVEPEVNSVFCLRNHKGIERRGGEGETHEDKK